MRRVMSVVSSTVTAIQQLASHALMLKEGARKLKCSGDHPACNRCERENINCNYSAQKPMGRPRKRRRDDTAIPASSEHVAEQQLSTTIFPDSFDLPGFNNLATPPGFDDGFGINGFQPDLGFSINNLPYTDAPMNNQLVQEATPPALK